VLMGLWHGANWTFVAWGAYHGLLLVGYRLFDGATVGTPIDKVMKKHWFVPFSVGAMFTAFVSSACFFRGKTLQSSGYVLGALFGSTHITGDFLLPTGTIALIFISLFLAVAQERSQFIDRLALQPARIQIPAYVLAFLALELLPATGPAPSKTDAATVAKAEATSKAETAPASNAGSAAAPKAEPAAPTSAEAKAEPKSPSKADTKSIETTVAPTAPTSAAPTVAGSPSPAGTKADGAFVVQLAAFADDKGANALANKLKKNGYSAYVEPINTSRGTLWRVRVGGYGTRPEADAARVALKGEGYSGIVATSQ